MNTQQKSFLKSLIRKKIKGYGVNLDINDVLPRILESILDDLPVVISPYSRLKRVEPYLYEMDFNYLDYEFGKEYVGQRLDSSVGKCTAVCVGNLVGRNLDETYDNSVSVVVRVAGSENTYSSIGIISGMPRLTKQLMESGANDDLLRAIPFYTTDAVNDQGLFVEINLLTPEVSKGRTTGTVPQVELRDKICMTMLPRYIVDHYSTVDEAISGITNYVSVYAPMTKTFNGEFHYFLTDGTKSVILEFINNEVYTREVGPLKDYPSVLVNFYANGVTLNNDGTITRNTSSTPGTANVNGITPYGQGIERHNLIMDELSSIQDEEDMIDLLRDLFYTNSYTLSQDQWYTEFVGGDLTVTSPSTDFADILQKAAQAYTNRDRNNPQTWQTIHSVVYDLSNKTLTVCVQEGSIYHSYAYQSYYEVPEVNNLIGDLSALETTDKSNLVAAINELAHLIQNNG